MRLLDASILELSLLVHMISSNSGSPTVGVSEGKLVLVFAALLASTCFVYIAANRAKQRMAEDADMAKSNRFSISLHSLQRRYLTVYILAMLSDWLQGPYVYALYESYGFDRHQNASLFVCGFASSMILGTFVGSFADRYGRRRFCLLYCWLYIVSCFTKHIPLYPVLLLGRLLGGMATSLLFSVFESWLICEATTSNQSDLISATLGVAVALNSATAILAGVLAQASVSLAPMRDITPGFKIGGYCSPFDLSIISLVITGIFVSTMWKENYGTKNEDKDTAGRNSIKEWIRGICQCIQANRSIVPLGCIQALYESSMYIFVFMWTPALEQANNGVALSLGLVFASFMTSCTLGSQIFRYFHAASSLELSSVVILRVVCLVALVSQATVIMWPLSPWSVMSCFLAFETSVGVYYPTMGTLKAQIVPEAYRATIYNLFRVPLNLIVVGALLAKLEVAEAFAVTSVLLFCALALSLRISNPSQTVRCYEPRLPLLRGRQDAS